MVPSQGTTATTVYKHTTVPDCCLSRDQGKTCFVQPDTGQGTPTRAAQPFPGVFCGCCLCSHSALLPQLLQTAEDVARMQEELESTRPLLAQAAKDTLATMEQLQVLLLDSPAFSKSDCSDWTQRLGRPCGGCTNPT